MKILHPVNRNLGSVLVTGATGAIGPRVVEALYQKGAQIRTLSRNPPPAGLFPANVEVHVGDITNSAAVRSAVKGIDAIIHLAALLHIINPSISLQRKYEEINVGGTATLVEEAMNNEVVRIVFFSTIVVYGSSDGQILSEKTHPRPDTIYAKTKLDAEKFVLRAKRFNGQPLGTVLRLGAIYGARIKGNYLHLVQSLARGRFIPIGDGKNRRTLIYDRDVAEAALLVLNHPAAVGQIFNVTDGQFHTVAEIITAMCDALGRTPPRLILPIDPIYKAAGLSEDILSHINLKSPLSRASINKYLEDIAVDGRRIQEQLGFSPKYDLAAGWKETVEEMRRSGDL